MNEILEIINSTDSQLEVSKKIRKKIKEYLARIKVEGGKDFFVSHTRQMDKFITGIYRYLLLQTFREYKPPYANIPIVLVALGSYGREQLSVYSDIDIMIVYEEVEGYNLLQLIERFVQMLWDLGLRIGHRVHKLEELEEVALSDWSIYFSFLDSRFIDGSKYLWAKVENRLNSIRKKNRKEALCYLYDYYTSRHRQFPISMEPDIKEGSGGIRDANTLYWAIKILFNYPNSSYLVPRYLSEGEYQLYRSSLEYLFKVRVFLHLVARRKEERVRLEYQREIALKMGYRDTPRLKAERRFIKDLLEKLWNISTISHITLRKVIKGYLHHCPFSKIREGRVAPGFSIIGRKISAKFNPLLSPRNRFEVILSHPFESGDISVVANLRGVPLSPSDTLPLFQTTSTYPKIMLLYRADKVEELLPPFKRIKHLAQFDGYHHYPVDIHSLYTLRELEELLERGDPSLSSIVSEIEERDRVILKLAALLHDIGKGYKGDHSLIGAKIVRSIGKKIGLTEKETELLSKLVKLHTLMSYTAQREDIYNDRTLLRFATQLETPSFLRLLYLLTLADTKAVGEGVLTDFKKRLLATLYYNTLELFQNPSLLTEEQKRQRKERLLKRHPEFQKLPYSVRTGILSSPSNQLFLQNGIEWIVGLGKWVASLIEQKLQFDFRIEREQFLKIEILKRTPLQFALGWFIDKLYKLDLKHLSIYRIGEFKYFRLEFEQTISEEFELQLIGEWIRDGFAGPRPLQKRIKIPREAVSIDCYHSLNSAAMVVEMEDRKGIVSTILQVFDQLQIWVEDVKIATIRGIASDLFILSKEGNTCDKVEQIYRELEKGEE